MKRWIGRQLIRKNMDGRKYFSKMGLAKINKINIRTKMHRYAKRAREEAREEMCEEAPQEIRMS